MTRFKKLFSFLGVEKGLIYVSVGNLFSTALGAILWFILASQMSAHDYGSLNYFIAIVSILTAIGVLGFDSTLTTFLAKGLNTMTREASSLVLISSVILSIGLFFVFMSISSVFLLLVMIYFTFSTSEILGRQSYKEFMYVMIIQRLLTLFLVPILFHYYGVDGGLYGFALAHLPLTYRFFMSIRHLKLSVSTVRPRYRFFVHSYMLGISKTLPYFSDKIIIVPIFGVIIAGYYQFGIQMLTVVSLVPVILYTYLLPRQAGGDTSSWRKTGILGIVSSILLIVTLIVLMPTIVNQFFPSFMNAISSSQILLLAGLPLTLVAIVSSNMMARERSIHVAISVGVFLGAQFSLIVTLGPLLGLVGLAVSTLAAATVQAIYLIASSRLGANISPVKRLNSGNTQ
jgi:O-antigen/teichoic acid export membrane protein